MRWQKEHAALMELLASPERPEELCLQAFGETIASYTRVNELLSSERGYPTAADDFSYRLHPGASTTTRSYSRSTCTESPWLNCWSGSGGE